jgi:hypothetical protein
MMVSVSMDRRDPDRTGVSMSTKLEPDGFDDRGWKCKRDGRLGYQRARRSSMPTNRTLATHDTKYVGRPEFTRPLYAARASTVKQAGRAAGSRGTY